MLRRAIQGALTVLVFGALAGCKEAPPRPPLARDGGDVERDAGTADAPPNDGPVGSDAGVDPGDGGPVDAPDSGPVVHPGTGTWSACVPDAVDRICYFLPAAITASDMDRTLHQRIGIDASGLVTEAGSVPPFDLRISPTSVVGEHVGVGSSAAGGGEYLDFMFQPGTPLDGWTACNPGPRRFRVLRAGTTSMALEFELDCMDATGVQIRGAILGNAAFDGWRTDPIDGL